MTQKNNADNSNGSVEKKSKNNKKKKRKFLKVTLLIILLITLVGTGIVGGLVYGAIKDVPVIDASNIDNLLNQNSFILDQNGNIVEKVLAEENRTAESLDNMPDHLQKAFISIEDERFYDHFGVDLRGILAALVEDIKAGAKVRGASTITQQLAKNVYLTNEKSIQRKLKEAYIAIKLEKQLTKDQILESYLNKIYLGQGAYGVKEAAFTYFSKEDLNDLTLAESALIAGITQNPTKRSPYITIKPQDVPENAIVIGNVKLAGEKYSAVFNEESIERQKVILLKMKQLGHISEYEYNEALNENIVEALKPGKKVFTDISSYFIDYVKQQVVEDLVAQTNITPEEAHREILTGGLRIYSTVDLKLQKDIEDMYTNFSQLVFGGGNGSSWKSDGSGNIVDQYNNLVYYKRSNLLDENGNLIIENGDYSITDRGLNIRSSKLNLYPKSIDIKDYYTLNGGHLVSHGIGSLDLSQNDYSIDSSNNLTIKNSYLNKVKDFYTIDGRNNLVISSNFFLDDETGIVQPQSSTVVIDHSTGQLKALVGGRNLEGSKILNRALTPRQPGSAIKPIAAYLPALDNGYNAGTGIDDVPVKLVDGKPWPRNTYGGYKGMMSVREAIRVSSNPASVKTVEDVGANTSKEYLKRLGVIKQDKGDSFVTKLEDKSRNDENSSALGLGGMTFGISPLDMAGAYAAIANEGTYIKPLSYTKVEDRYGNVLLENKPKKTTVVSPGVAYVMTDLLRDVVTSGTGTRASVSGVTVVGKTGTTSDNTDAWFVGYSPQYTASVWIGNDSPAVKLPNGSRLAAQFWSKIMTRVHSGVPKQSFKEPSDIVRRSVCTLSGKLPTSLCSGEHVKTELFAKGHEPTGSCDMHVSVRIDVTTNLLASANCPASFVQSKSMFKINPPFMPSRFGGVTPSDYSLRAPSSYCNVNHELIPEVPEPDQTEEEILDDSDDTNNTEDNGNIDPPKDNPDTNNGNNGNVPNKDKVDNIIDSILNPNKDKSTTP